MRTALIAVATASSVVPALALEAPFVPPGVTPPDHVVTMVEKAPWATRTGPSCITYHGPWSRAEPTAVTDGSAEYFASDRSVQISRSARSIGFARVAGRDSDVDYQPRNTGQQQTHLGESCTVWDVARTKPGHKFGSRWTRLSCVTDDGIELWQKRVSEIELWQKHVSDDGTYSQEAAHLERRPVSAEASTPPPRLAADWWDEHAPPPGVSDAPDHEIVMKLDMRNADALAPVSTNLHSGAWKKTDTTSGPEHHITIVHDPTQFTFVFSTDDAGRPKHLYMARLDRPADPSGPTKAEPAPPPERTGISETILGESCDWAYLETGAEGGLETCIAADRVILAEREIVRPFRTHEWTAVSVIRRPVKADEIRPPPELFDPHYWRAG